MAKTNPKISTPLAGGCLSLFGLPFLAAGLFVSWIYFVGFADWWRARNWVEMPCWIESAELKEDDGGDSTTYKAVATYRYNYEGREYRGERVSLGKGSDNMGNFQRDAHAELAAHVAGPAASAEADPRQPGAKPFRCFVNPRQPDESVLYRMFRWQMQAFMAVFALTFPAVGAGLVAGGFLASRAIKKDTELRAIHPGEPWKWKPDWAGSSIPETARAWSGAYLLYTAWTALVILPLIATTLMSGAFFTEKWASLVLIFAFLWLLLAGVAIKRLRQRLAIGSPRFEMAVMPASPGGTLAGAIVLEKPLPLRGDAELTLTCEKKTTHPSSDGDSTTTEKIWSHREPLAMDGMTRDVSGFRVPVSFVLPPDAPQSEGGDDSKMKHVWKLQLNVPGTAISPAFEVPVFRTGNSPELAPGPAAVPSIARQVEADLPALLASGKIRAEFDSRGFPLSIHCPASRHLGMIGFLLFFNLIWTGVAVFLIYKDAPLIFRIVWPVSASVIWLIIIYQLLHSRSVTLHDAGMEVVNRLGPWSRATSIPKTGITGFSHDTNMTSGNTVYYRVRLEDVFGKKTTLVDGISGSATAEALAGRLDDWRTAS